MREKEREREREREKEREREREREREKERERERKEFGDNWRKANKKCLIIKVIFRNLKGTKDDRDEDEINFQDAIKAEKKFWKSWSTVNPRYVSS